MQQIGRYQIVGELGRGAMGIVYRAQDPTIGRTIAIKTIRLSDLTEPSERQRLRDRLVREAQSAGILSHPGIVTIYDIQEESDVAYIFMEFVDGPPLEKALASDKPPDRERLVEILRQTGAALDYAHRKGIVHRDIKPANIMIAEDGSAKIADFGVAKIVSQQMTQVGAMMGTPTYMSPEQVQGRVIDGRADQFSLAVIAYELLTGEKPFISDYLPTLLYKIVSEEPIAPQRLNPSLGQQVEQVLRKAMAKDPAGRYETCTDFVNALIAACNAKKNWRPLPRGASQSLPTVATTGGASAAVSPAQKAEEKQASAPALPPARKPHRVGDEPVKPSAAGRGAKAIGGVAAGVILVGLAFLGAQKFLHIGAGDAEADKPKEPVVSTAEPAKPEPAVPRPSPAGEAVKKPSPAEPPPAAQDKPAEPLPVKPEVASPPRPVAPPPKAPAPTEQVVEFASSPAGATLVFDNNPQLTCTTPCSLALPKGRHTFVANLPGYRQSLKIFETAQGTVSFGLDQMAGTLAVKSNPAGASIFVDGHERSEKTPALLKLTASKHHVRLMKEGFAPYEEEVEIKDSVFQDMNVSWK